MADPPQLSRSYGRHERLLCCSSVYLVVGDSVEAYDAKYDAIAASGKGIDAVLIGWTDDPTLTAVCVVHSLGGVTPL